MADLPVTTTRRARIRRGLARAVLLGSFAIVGVTITAPHAAAAIPVIGDCKPAPIPDVPGRGISGWFGRPATIPPTEDPFAPGATTTVYEQFDLAGMSWDTYDLGCTGNDLNASAHISTNFGNICLDLAKLLVAATSGVLRAAFNPSFMSVFDGMINQVVQALTTGVLQVWLPVVMLGVGLLLLYRAGRQQTSALMHAVGWAIIVMVAAAALVHYPVQAGHAADKVIVTTASSVNGAINGKSTADGTGAGKAAQLLYDSVLYRQWLAGELGSPDSPIAKKYGPQLLHATAFTWAEAHTLDTDPKAGEKLFDAKQQQFKDLADKIKKEDPNAYATLKGETKSRASVGLITLLAAFLTVPFLLAAGIIMLTAYLVIRFAVMLFPALATLGVARPLGGIITGVRDTVAAAVINSAMFSAGAAVAIKVLGFTLNGSGLPPWLGFFLSALTSLVLWRMLRTLRTATRMATGRNPVGDGFGSTPAEATRSARWIRGIATTYIGTVLGTRRRDRPPPPDGPGRPEQGTEPEYVAAERPTSVVRYEAAPQGSQSQFYGTGWPPPRSVPLGTGAVRGDTGGREVFEGPAAEPVDSPQWIPAQAPAHRDPVTGDTVYVLFDAATGTTTTEHVPQPSRAAAEPKPAAPTAAGQPTAAAPPRPAAHRGAQVYDLTAVTAEPNRLDGRYVDGARVYGEDDLARRMAAAREDPNILNIHVSPVDPDQS